MLLNSCGNNNDNKLYELNAPDETQLVKANKHITRTENELINDFISRYNWKMIETGSGLRYMIYKKTEEIKAQTNMIAQICFEVRLLDGTLIYSSKTLGNKEFVIGRGGIESGLEEGILYMKKGEKAKFILPSHLAFGLVGDGKKIPSRATLVYDIELLNLTKK